MDNMPPDGEEVDGRDIAETQFLGGTFTSGFYGKFIFSVKKKTTCTILVYIENISSI